MAPQFTLTLTLALHLVRRGRPCAREIPSHPGARYTSIPLHRHYYSMTSVSHYPTIPPYLTIGLGLGLTIGIGLIEPQVDPNPNPITLTLALTLALTLGYLDVGSPGDEGASPWRLSHVQVTVGRLEQV